MGKRGPSPTPSAVLLARGSWRGSANQHEPRPCATAPLAPKRLNKAARQIWSAAIATIAPGVLTADCGPTLARYCHALARWWALAKWLDTHDDTYSVTDDRRNERHLRHPNVITYEKLSRDLLRLEQEFGLTPASRTRIHADLRSQTKAPAQARQASGAPILRIAR